ncbi:hypothetical protein B0A55_13166, partial [Friedmanniomyces simplex]
SRPLSQAFARLRERSRSISTGRSKSTKSRPASLVIAHSSGLVLDEEDERSFTAAAAGASDTANANSGGGRREVWAGYGGMGSDDEGRQEEVGAGSGSGSGTPGRLGVLPSPGVETFGSSIAGSPSKRGEGVDELPVVEDDEGSHEGHDGERGPPAEVPSTPARDAHETPIPDTPVRAWGEDLGASPSTPPSTAIVADRPSHGRKVSALASLPSQQRARGFDSPRSPASVLKAMPDSDLGDDELYERTPVASTAKTPWSGDQDGAQILASGRERTFTPTVLSGPGSAADYESSRSTPAGGKADDQRSEVSAEEEIGTVHDSKVLDDSVQDVSRRSSISSLGSPDTVVGRRVSRILRDREMDQSSAAAQVGMDSHTAVRALPTEPGAPTQGPSIDREEMTNVQNVQPSSPPPGLAQGTSSASQQTFMDRPYRGRIANSDRRALSYMPLGSDENGAPVQEALDIGVDEPSPSVDLSGFTGPPTGTPPFQQHPLFRNSGYVLPSEYEKLRSSPVGTITPSTRHSRHISGEASRRSSKRLSSFFRRSDVPTDSVAGADAGAPAPHAMTPSYGLEDLDTVGAEAMLNAAPTQSKSNKRRSGIWDAFKRSPSVSRTQFSRDSSVLALDSRTEASTDPAPYAMSRDVDQSAQQRTLKKPQRAASAATPQPEPTKKKRFSGLGSLFGRSSTQGRNTPNPKKLTKTQPPSRESSVRPGTASQTVGREGYEAFETLRREQIPNLQQRSTSQPWSGPAKQHTPVDPDAPFATIPRALPHRAIQSEPEEWHSASGSMSPANNSPHAPQLVHIQRPESRSQYRSLHSAAFQHGLQQARIPEAFRPVEASYGKQVEPIGPPVGHQPPVMYRPPQMPRQPTLPTQQSYWNTAPPVPDQSPAPVAARQSQVSVGGGSPPFQGSSRADQPSWGQRINTTMTPVSNDAPGQHAPPQSSPLQDDRVGSLGQEMARSPAQQYADQQTPWAINAPRPGHDSHRPSRAPLWAAQQGARPETATYPDATNVSAPVGYAQRHMLPMSPQSPGGIPYGYPVTTQSPPLDQAAKYPDLYARGPSSGHQASRYPSPPYTPQSPINNNKAGYGPPPSAPYYQSYEERYAPPEQQPPFQRYTAPPRNPYPQGGRALSYQRTPSGFSGRRDDAAVSEQELLGMRGASYPGQEWAPRM